MKAIILAAGRGSRLLSLTDDRPKCLIELHGKALLDWQLEALRDAGIKEIMVVRGYCREQITGNFATADNPRWHETNMVATLMAARDWLSKGSCIVSYSDIVYPAAAVEKLVGNSQESALSIIYDSNWLVLWKQRFNDPLSDAESFMQVNGVLKDIGRSSVSYEVIQGQYMGLLKFTPTSAQWVFDILDTNQELCDKLDMTALLRLLIEDDRKITAVPWVGKWCEIDTPRDLKIAEACYVLENSK